MLASSIPTKIVLPFANNAGGSYINVVPVDSQIGITNGAASFYDGFPPNCFIALSAGGAGPFGKDFNGLLNVMSAWNRWACAGGPILYDATFQSTIGGYPNGAIVGSGTTAGKAWCSTVDNNTSDPDTGGANWASVWLIPGNNLSDLPNASTSRTNLGLGTMAVQNANAVLIVGGSIHSISQCAINTSSNAAGFTVTCPNPAFEWIDEATNNTWVLGMNSTTFQLNLNFNNGNVGTFDHTTGTYTAVSDVRLKENVIPLEEVLPSLSLVRPIRYNFKADGNKRQQIGLIAQELEKVFPEFVSSVGDDLLGINYAGLTVIALKAIQELASQVSDLKKQLSQMVKPS